MKLELSYYGVGQQRRYFVTAMTAGRPRHSTIPGKTRKTFGVGPTRQDAISDYLSKVGFKPAEALA